MLRFVYILICLFFTTNVYAEKFTIITGNRGNLDVTFSEFANKYGYLNQCNVEFEHMYTNGGGEALQLMIAARGDIAIGIPVTNVAGAYQKGAPIKLVGSSYIGNDLIWYVDYNSDITKVADLENKKIGISTSGSFSDMITDLLHKKTNVNFEVNAVGGNAAMLVAVKTKQIDVGFFTPPSITDNLLNKEIKVLFSTADIFPERENLTSRTIITSNNAFENKKEIIKCWMDGVTKSIDYFYSTDEGAKKYADMVGVSLESVLVAKKMIKREHFQLSKIVGIEQLIKEGIEYKFIKAPGLSKEQLDDFVKPLN